MNYFGPSSRSKKVNAMNKLALLLVAVAFCLVSGEDAQAQVGYVTYYHPTTVYHAPVTYVPQTVYYAPAPVRTVYKPVAQVRTRYRPILGGSVTRVRYGYAPAYVAPVAPVVYAY